MKVNAGSRRARARAHRRGLRRDGASTGSATPSTASAATPTRATASPRCAGRRSTGSASCPTAAAPRSRARARSATTCSLHLRPDVCGHVNGGTTSLDEDGARDDRPRDRHGAADRAGRQPPLGALHREAGARGAARSTACASPATRRPGTGVMPMGVHQDRLRDRLARRPRARSRDRARHREQRARLSPGCRHRTIAVGARPTWSSATRRPRRSRATRSAAIARGDIPGISCVIIDGQVRVGRSRNTPAGQAPRHLHGRRGGAAPATSGRGSKPRKALRRIRRAPPIRAILCPIAGGHAGGER